MTDDTIYRQAAIEALYDWELSYTWDEHCKEDYDSPYIVSPSKVIEGLPSAQPEIIRCKDCRWGREVCGNIECFTDTNVPPEYHGYEWFCPNGERRTDD